MSCPGCSVVFAAAVLNPGYSSLGGAFVGGLICLEDATTGLQLQLRTPEAGGFFGLCKEEGWDFSDCWMMGQHEPCAAAVKALKSMGTPELSKAACDPNKNAMYKECLAAA